MPCDSPLFRRVLRRFLRAVVAADCDLFATDPYVHSAILDFPVAHGALHRLHEMSPLKLIETESNATVTTTFAGDSHEEMISRREKSDFQILAHFAKPSAAGAAYVGGRAAKLVAEGVGEVAVAGKA